jgi:hypothetical protein
MIDEPEPLGWLPVLGAAVQLAACLGDRCLECGLVAQQRRGAGVPQRDQRVQPGDLEVAALVLGLEGQPEGLPGRLAGRAGAR